LWIFRRYQNAVRLNEGGTVTSVRILDAYISSDSDSTSYYIAYQLPGGEPFRQAVSKKAFERLPVGSTANVRYLYDNPQVFRLEMD
jgi:hypothetical protein